MKDLILLYKTLGFKNIETYIQSGNILFETTESNKIVIVHLLETAIREQYGFEVHILLRTMEEISLIIANIPCKIDTIDPKYVHICFFSGVPIDMNIQDFGELKFGKDAYVIMGDMMYIYYDPLIGSGRSKLTLHIIEKKLGIIGTARNWNVVTQINHLLSLYVHL